MDTVKESEQLPSVVIVGMRGVGKSSVARRLAEELQVPMVDADDAFVAEHGLIAAYFAAHGEAAFRQAEAAILQGLLAASPGWVVATGGGVVTQADNRSALQAAPAMVLYLHADASVLEQRLGRDRSEARPTLMGGASVAAEAAALLAEREPWYRAVADAEIDASQGVTAIVEACLEIIALRGKLRR
jgi:shikimate kinase